LTVVLGPLEEKDVGFWRMNLVVLPSQTLSDSQASPLILLQYLEGASLGVEVILGDHLEHAFWKHHVPILVVVIGITVRVVDAVNELLETVALSVGQETRTGALLGGHTFGSCGEGAREGDGGVGSGVVGRRYGLANCSDSSGSSDLLSLACFVVGVARFCFRASRLT